MDPEAKVNKLTAVGFYLLKDLLLQLAFLQSDAIIPKGEEISNFRQSLILAFSKSFPFSALRVIILRQEMKVFLIKSVPNVGRVREVKNEGASHQKCG